MPAFFYCNGCHYTRKSSDEYAGMSIPCPQCGRKGIIENYSKNAEPRAIAHSKVPSLTPEPAAGSAKEPVAANPNDKTVPRPQAGSPPPGTPPTAGEDRRETKECPYCAEKILKNAKKCKHCGEFLTNESRFRRPAPPPPSVRRAAPEPKLEPKPDAESDAAEESEDPPPPRLTPRRIYTPTVEQNTRSAFLCGLFGIFIFQPILGLIALLTGSVCIRKISRNPELGGKGLATAALILGILDILIGTVVIIVLLSRKPPVS